MPDPAKLALNQITTKRWSLAEAIDGCVRHGVRGISVWRDKLAEMGVPAAARAVMSKRSTARVIRNQLLASKRFTKAAPWWSR